jgi:hypothetical protein
MGWSHASDQKESGPIASELRGHFLELVAARLSPEPLDREVDAVAQTVFGQIQELTRREYRL